MPDRLIRTFIAVDLPEEIRKVANDLRPTVGANPSAVKWVVEENIHLTLRFIGPTAPGEVEKINGLLEDTVRRHADFSLTVSGVGCFPKQLTWTEKGAAPRSLAQRRRRSGSARHSCW